jgi:hypothetical protein
LTVEISPAYDLVCLNGRLINRFFYRGIEVLLVKANRRKAITTGLTPRSTLLSLILALLVFVALCTDVEIGSAIFWRENNADQMTATTKRDNHKQQHSVPFYEALEKALKKRKVKLEGLCSSTDAVGRRILEEYGAVFVATKKVLPPPRCVFANEEEVLKFQEEAGYDEEKIGFDYIELQPEALKQLRKARGEAQKEGLDITPRDGAEAARRNYEDSVRLWNSRFLPALEHWLSKGRLNAEQIAQLKSLPLSEQVAEVLELEKQGIYFSKDLSKSILYSIAAPGSSQHIHMLAFDVNEFANPRVREILAKHGWFQTVLSDLPHFTFLGLKEKDLPKHGLRNVELNGQMFWIPNVEGLIHPGLDK